MPAETGPEPAVDPKALDPPADTALGRFLWRVLPFIRPYKKRVAVGIGTNAMARMFDLLPMVVVGLIIDHINRASDLGLSFETQTFVLFGLGILGTFIGLAIFQTTSDYAWDTLAQKVRHDLRVRLYQHLQTLDVSYFENRQTGDIMSVVSNDVDQLENFLADATTSIVRLAITFIGIFGFLLWLDWRLALLLFAPLPLALFVVKFFATRVQPQYRASREAVGSMNAILENNLQGIGVIQAYTAEAHQAERVDVQSAEYRDAAERAAGIRARFIPYIYVIAGAAFTLLITVGGWLTFAGYGPSLGDFVVFILFAMRLIMPLFILGFLLNQIQRSEAAARRIYEILGTAAEVKDAPDALPVPQRPEEIVFDDVHFAYRDRAPVLNGVSFQVHDGQVLGVVGPTGAGKSTLIKLLLRYYEPRQGQILIDGKPLDRLRLSDYRHHIGYVSQEAFLFSGTVADNIRLGTPEATDAQVREAAEIAGAHEFIAQLPEQYATRVGERGLKLSGGQRQRVSLARAVLRDPAILILDEATSAVDTRTEELIQHNLHRFRRGRITIAIAHRLSTIRQADEILVIVDGVVVERGDHDTLVAQRTVYADLWRVQSGQTERGEGVYGEPVRVVDGTEGEASS